MRDEWWCLGAPPRHGPKVPPRTLCAPRCTSVRRAPGSQLFGPGEVTAKIGPQLGRLFGGGRQAAKFQAFSGPPDAHVGFYFAPGE